VFNSMAKLGRRAVQLGGQAWPLSWTRGGKALPVSCVTQWPSMASELFHLIAKLGQLWSQGVVQDSMCRERQNWSLWLGRQWLQSCVSWGASALPRKRTAVLGCPLDTKQVSALHHSYSNRLSSFPSSWYPDCLCAGPPIGWFKGLNQVLLSWMTSPGSLQETKGAVGRSELRVSL
jgi:hypothetical protein